MSMNLLKKILKWVALSFAVVLLLLIVCFFSIMYWLGKGSQLDIGRDKFNKEIWLSGPGDHRCYMYKDLVKNKLRKGMRLNEVEDLIGKSNVIYYSRDGAIKCMSYYAGDCSKNKLEGAKSSWYLKVCVDKRFEVNDFFDYEYLRNDKRAYELSISCNIKENNCYCAGIDPFKKITFQTLNKECGIKPW